MSGTVEADMRYLGTFDDGGGFVAFTNNVRLIETVEDLEGLNIRTEENPAHVAIMRRWALPHAVTLGRANHRIGNRPCRWAVQCAGAQHHLQLRCSHRLPRSPGMCITAPWVVSESWYQSLPETHQQAVISSARKAIQLSHGMSGALATASWVESCERFEACYLMPDAERERMAEVARPLGRRGS